MSAWIETSIENITEFVSRGITPKYVDNGILVLNQKCIRDGVVDISLCRMTDIESRIPEQKYVKSGDILINSTGSGTLGRTAFYRGNEEWLTADGHVTILRAKQEVSSRYLGYYLHSIEPVFDNLYHGSTNQTELYPKDIKALKIKLPAISEQTRIAEILSAYDDAIENNNRRIALLEQSARELYREWFVRMRFPGHENAKFVNGLPEGWEVVSFGALAEIIDGDRGVNYPKQDEFFSEGHCLFLNAGNVTKDGFAFSNNAFITEEKDKKLRKGKLSRGDIVLTTRGTVGNTAFYNSYIPYDVVRINSGMVILRDSGDVPAEFLYITLRSKSVQKMIELYSSGSAQPQLPIKDMRKMKILKPTPELLTAFSRIAGNMLSESALLQSKSQNLARQRDMLLPRLMSGKLEV